MTGTSCDGLDLALLEISGHGENLQPKYLRGTQHDLGDLGPQLRRLAEGHACTLEELCRINNEFSSHHVQCIKASEFGQIDLFVPHGQTLYHAPPLSIQLINLQKIASELMVPVIGDLRGLDLARGGQGAPITPKADHFFYGRSDENRVVLNLGGFCNLSFLSSNAQLESIQGFDVCATNLLLDLLARKVLDRPYDFEGQGASEGTEIPALRQNLEARLKRQHLKGQSLGQRDLPHLEWMEGQSLNHDLLKTACLAIGSVIGSAVHSLKADRLLVAGGGAHNQVLMHAISQSAGLLPEPCGNYGPPSEYREAASMALLGTLSYDRVPITLESVTGAKGSFISGLTIDPRYP